MSKESLNRSSGIVLGSHLAIVFIVLKLTGTIAWAWPWVLAPMWITLLIAVAIVIILGSSSHFKSRY